MRVPLPATPPGRSERFAKELVALLAGPVGMGDKRVGEMSDFGNARVRHSRAEDDFELNVEGKACDPISSSTCGSDSKGNPSFKYLLERPDPTLRVLTGQITEILHSRKSLDPRSDNQHVRVSAVALDRHCVFLQRRPQIGGTVDRTKVTRCAFANRTGLES